MDTERLPLRVRIKNHILDFCNTLKANIANNYLNIAFAFSQSGLVLGSILLVIVALSSVHCCALLLESKKTIIRRRLADKRADQTSHSYGTDSSARDEELSKYQLQLERTILFQDVADEAFGASGKHAITFFIFLTQYLCCINYFIFLGQTLDQVVTTLVNMSRGHHISYDPWSDLIPANHSIYNITNISTTTSTTTVAPTHPPESDWAPPLFAAVLVFMPLFLLTSLIRNMRTLGPLSAVGNIALISAISSVFFTLVNGFTVDPDIKLAKWESMPFLFGTAAGALEGIGVVLTLETSMDGNRQNFLKYLWGAIMLVTAILCTFGSLGYMRYGDKIEQIILLSFSNGSTVVVVVRILAMIAVICTFPVQMFPVHDMAEHYFYAFKKWLSHENTESDTEEEQESLLGSVNTNSSRNTSHGHTSGGDVDLPALQWVPLRFILVIIAAGIGVLLDDYIAYLNTFNGAFGCTILAFIMPTIIHNVIHQDDISLFTYVKNWSIAIFGGAFSLACIVTTIRGLVLGNSV